MPRERGLNRNGEPWTDQKRRLDRTPGGAFRAIGRSSGIHERAFFSQRTGLQRAKQRVKKAAHLTSAGGACHRPGRGWLFPLFPRL